LYEISSGNHPEAFTKRRTEITIETHRWVRISRRETVGLWCGECAAQIEAVSPEQVAQLLRISTREVYRRIEAGEFHIHEIPAGRLLISQSSQLATILTRINTSPCLRFSLRPLR